MCIRDSYWHTLGADGTDMFGWGTMQRPWTTISDPMDKAKVKVDAIFEFCEKLGIPFFCFHDRDIAPEGDTLRETNRNLDVIVGLIEDHIKTSPVRLLWGTANMFSNPRFVHGVASSGNAGAGYAVDKTGVAEHVGCAPQQSDRACLYVVLDQPDDDVQVAVGLPQGVPFRRDVPVVEAEERYA